MTEDAFERAAHKELVVERRRGFRIHLFVYLAVQVLLFATWALTSNDGQVMPWFVFPLLGWGIGVVAHYFAVRDGFSTRDGPPVA